MRMLVKVSSGWSWVGKEIWKWFDPATIFDGIKDTILKTTTLPKALWWPLWWASLNEAIEMFSPNDSKIVKGIADNAEKQSSEEKIRAVDVMRKSTFWNLLGMDTEADFTSSYKKPDFKLDKSNPTIWSNETQNMIGKAKDIVASEDKYKNLPITKNSNAYGVIKKWQESIGEIMDNTFGYDKDGAKIEKWYTSEKWNYSSIYDDGSYSAALLDYFIKNPDKKLKLSKGTQGAQSGKVILDPSIKISNTTKFSGLDLGK